MRLILSVVVAALLVSASAPQAPPALQRGDVVITGGRIFDGVRDTLAANTGLVIRRGIFLEVGANLTGRDTSAAEGVLVRTQLVATSRPLSTALNER
jgi:hypothetical protein